jgi:hypothetical protein
VYRSRLRQAFDGQDGGQVGAASNVNQELRCGWGVILHVAGAQGVVNTTFENSAETARKKRNFEATLA